jgi:hypothetical protein
MPKTGSESQNNNLAFRFLNNNVSLEDRYPNGGSSANYEIKECLRCFSVSKFSPLYCISSLDTTRYFFCDTVLSTSVWILRAAS